MTKNPDGGVFNQLLDHMEYAPIGYYQASSNGDIIYANISLARMLGFESPEQLISSVSNIGELYATRSDFERLTHLIEIDGEVIDFQCSQIGRGKNVFRASINARAIKSDSSPIYHEGFVTKAAEIRKTGKKGSLIEKTLSLVPDLVSIQDPEMNIIYSNWGGFVNVPEEKRQTGQKCYKLYRNFDHVCPDCISARVLKTKKGIQQEVNFQEERWFDIRVIPILNEKGDVVCFVEWVRDITERKQAEKDLYEQKCRIEAIINAIPDILFIQNPDLTIEHYNQAGYDFVKMGPEELKNKKCYHLIGRNSRCDICATSEAIKNKRTVEIERYIPELNVHQFIRSTPLMDASGNVTQVVQIIRDITERKKFEEEQKKLLEELFQARKMESVATLVGGVAHEFNNKLCMINLSAESILEEVDSENPIYQRIEDIVKTGLTSAELVKQLMGFARKQIIRPIELDLGEFIPEMLEIYKTLVKEDTELVWKSGRDLWLVKIDPFQIDQILTNLCSNAGDAITQNGKIVIETSNVSFNSDSPECKSDLLPGDYVMLSVRDNGCGIENRIRNRLFEPFFTTKPVGKGTGLGLSMVYGIIKQNEGFITVDSNPGEGTTFSIYIHRYLSQTSLQKYQVTPTHAQMGKNILLVEDEPRLMSISRKILESRGYRVFASLSPFEALRLANSHAGEIDLLLTDVTMPGMNGFDLATAIKDAVPGVKSLFMSGQTAELLVEQGAAEGKINLIRKPFTTQTLIDQVTQTLLSD